MRKLVVRISALLPVLLAIASGCDATRRDYTVCDRQYYQCNSGFTCDFTVGLCVPEKKDAALSSDVAVPDAGPMPDGEDVDLGRTDAPAPVDTSAVEVQEPIDSSIVDAPQTVDGAAPDTRVPDAAGSCSVDNDCVGVPGGALCVNARCVACKANSQCNNDAGTPFCSTQNTCVSCASSTGNDAGVCLGANPVCNATSGSCVECLRNGDCLSPGKGFCVANKCVGCDFPGASGTSGGVDGGAPDGGAAGGPACSGSKPACVPSGSDAPLAGQCVQCVTSSDCGGNTPVCNSSNQCVPCSLDSQCTTGPGICMRVTSGPFQQDGRCATDAEAIYVQNSSGCSGGAGTKESPYCQPQSAINAVTSSKRVIVMSGTAALASWSASLGSSAAPIYVIGKNNPTISVSAADIGIHVISGSVYIRGLTVQGSGSNALNPGVVVESGAVLGLDRCMVMGNAGGVLASDGSGYDISNSVFAKNLSGSMGAAVFGGAYLGSPGTGLSHRFWFNTIADNDQFGVACTTKTQTLDGCLLSGDAGGEVVNCTLAATTKSPNRSPSGVAGSGFLSDSNPPLFSSSKPYHLTLGTSKATTSPCKDFITDTSVPFPPTDLDGQERPNNAAVDCGADEYWP
jgi:hypothetical protein